MKESELIKMLQEDNGRLRESGCELAIAALRVIKEYDGIHRLALAVSKWSESIANEGNRKTQEDK